MSSQPYYNFFFTLHLTLCRRGRLPRGFPQWPADDTKRNAWSPLHKKGEYKKKLISTLTLPLLERRSALLKILRCLSSVATADIVVLLLLLLLLLLLFLFLFLFLFL